MSKSEEEKLGKCPVLVKNLETFSSSFRSFIPCETEFKEVNKEEVLRNYVPLNIYTACFNEIVEKHSIPSENFEDVRKYLEAAAILYLAIRQRRLLKTQVGNIVDYFNKVGTKARELEHLLNPGA